MLSAQRHDELNKVMLYFLITEFSTLKAGVSLGVFRFSYQCRASGGEVAKIEMTAQLFSLDQG